ncbi:hypothetical protein AAIH20_34540, partial [Pseudomonas aeruginosa]|uniref:hypothetical protein n=1 Tax=Pseudomonas aeruginosa TaxID=287 RepID=UPI0031B6EA80
SIPMAITVIRHGITLDELDAWGSVADLGSEILEGEVKAFGKMTAGAPSHIVCKVLAEGMSEGSARYDLLSSVRRIPIHGKDHFRPLLLSAGKTWHQLSGYWNGRR